MSEPEPAESPPASGHAPQQPDPLLRTYLADRDAQCPSCGYSLRGLASDHCPECNQALALRVNLVEPRLGWWVTGLVGLAAGAGFSTLLLLFFFVVVVFGGRGPRGADPFLLSTGIGTVVEGVLLLFWLSRGRALRRRGNPLLGTLAIGCWVVTIVNFVAFSMFVR